MELTPPLGGASGNFSFSPIVELIGIEPTTYSLRTNRSPN